MRALIVEAGSSRGAVAGVRGLQAAGWSVGVASPVRGPAAWSRCSRWWHRIPPVERSKERFLDAIRDAIADVDYEIVFGAGDAEVLVLSEARQEITAHVPHAPHDAVRRALDKLELTEAARDAGLGVPLTWLADSPTPRDVTWPIVVKDRLHGPSPSSAKGGPIQARIATNLDEVRSRVAEVRARGGRPLLQEYVRGRLIAWSGVMDPERGLVAAVQQEAIRMWPPDAGVTARGITVAVSPALSAAAEALLDRLSWWGLAQLQFLQLPEEAPKLIDLNGRFYGSLGLAIGAGANLPAVWAASATGRPLPEAAVRPGERFQWLEGDVRSALARGPRVALPRLAGCLRYAVGAHHSVWRRDDPLPAVRYAGQLTRRAIARPRRRSATARPPSRPARDPAS